MITTVDRFEDWLRNKNLKERTIENYIYYFNKFVYDKFDQETVSRFLSKKSNRNSIARSFLVNFQKFLVVNFKELKLPKEDIEDIATVELPKRTGRTAHKLINPIPHDQIPLLEKALDTEQLKLQLLLSYYCGLRLGELLKITILSFNWEEWKKDTKQMGECKVYGKGDKEGIALVPPELMVRIAKFIQGKRWDSVNARLFFRGNGSVNLKNKSRSWQMKLRKAGIDSGITKVDANGEVIHETVVHPHLLRHARASYLLNVLGWNLREVQEFMRHTDIRSTQIYTHISKEHLKEKLSSNL